MYADGKANNSANKNINYDSEELLSIALHFKGPWMRARKHKSQAQVKEKEAWSWEKKDVAIDSQWSLFLQMLPIFLVTAQQLSDARVPSTQAAFTDSNRVGVPPLDAGDLSGYCPSISVLIEPEIRVPHLHLLWCV